MILPTQTPHFDFERLRKYIYISDSFWLKKKISDVKREGWDGMNIYSASSPISKSIKVVGVIAFGKFLESAFISQKARLGIGPAESNTKKK